ncbi:MAG: hypothetical protein ACYTEG_06985 [Planctomycetota bacterium]|jgi:hypothetical protein
MKWLLFTLAIVAALVGLGIWSVMPPSVVWEGRDPYCSRCRAGIRHYSRQCSECDRSLRWTNTDEECRWCLSKEDADDLKDTYRALKVEEAQHIGLLKQFPKAYFEVMESGACANCAGLGKINRGDAEITCPVCRGGESCIGCDGDRETVIGDESAHRAMLARRAARERAQRRSDLTHRPVRLSSLVDEDVEALSGYGEAEKLTDERGQELLKIARSRAGLAFQALEAAHREKVGDK